MAKLGLMQSRDPLSCASRNNVNGQTNLKKKEWILELPRAPFHVAAMALKDRPIKKHHG
jgi:hypothetical protein